MKKKVYLSLSTLLIGFVLSFPITKSRVNNPPTNLPEINSDLNQLEEYIQKKESNFTNIVDGAEKKVTWWKDKAKTDLAIVYIHGFSATRQETAPLAKQVADTFQANLFETRLTGHGQNAEAMVKAKAEDWLMDAAEAYQIGKLIGNKIIFITVSTGSPLGTWIINHKEWEKDIAGIVFISSNFYPANKLTKVFLYPLGTEFAKLIMGKERHWEPSNDIAKKYWTHRYPLEALIPMITLVEHLKDTDYSKLQVPALFLYTEHDNIVDVKKIEEVHSIYGSTKKRILNMKEIKEHIMAGDAMSPKTTPLLKVEIDKFIGSLDEIRSKERQ